jgi:hypothetical protein
MVERFCNFSKEAVFMQHRLSLLFSVLLLAAVLVVGVDTFAQGFAAPSGCRTTTLKNTLPFTQARTGNPGDTGVVMAAFTIRDDDVADTGVVEQANCVPPGPADNHPTHVTAIRVSLAGGDLVAADVRMVRLFEDGNEDGFFQAGQDRQVGENLSGTCLYTECVFTYGRTTPIFTIDPSGFESFIVVVELGPNTRSGANLMVNLSAEANDVVTQGPASVSSDFNDTYRSQTSNIILNAPDWRLPPFLSLNNGSGNPETGYRAVEVTGLKTRFRDDEIKPGMREAIAALIYVCEGGLPVTNKIVFKTQYSDATPTIAGYPGALACVTTSNPDELGTRLLRLRVSVSGNVSAVGTIRLYDDANDNGLLFEDGELVLSTNPINGIATFGTLNNPLLSSTRRSANPAPGQYAPQTKPITLCDSGERNPQPDGASTGCPHVLLLTFDVSSNAPAGDVIFDIGVDVGNLPGEGEDAATASSNLLSTAPTRSQVTIAGNASPVKTPSRLIAEHSGNPNLIEDSDILWAIGQWAKNEPFNGNAPLSDKDVLNAIRLWSDGVAVPMFESRTMRRR